MAIAADQARRQLSGVSLESQKLTDQLPELEKGLLTATDDKVRKVHEYE
jgi:hypothetical protein